MLVKSKLFVNNIYISRVYMNCNKWNEDFAKINKLIAKNGATPIILTGGLNLRT